MIGVLRRFVPPYKWYVALNMVFNVLSTILSLFSFATIIPVLQLLFGLSSVDARPMDIAQASGLQEMVEVGKNNIYYFLECQIAERGGSYVLLLLGGCLVVLTGLKCLTAWLANYFLFVRACCVICARVCIRKW